MCKEQASAPFRQTELHLRHGEGFDVIYPAIDEAELKGVIEVSRQGWITWGKEGTDDYVKIRGKDKLRTFFQENPDKFQKLLQVNSKTNLPTGQDVDF